MLYRFRTCNDFLFDELEKKYIYFSDIKDFNDYGENNINLIFEGDIIAWRGFLRHYISSLFLTICFGKFEEDSKVIIHIEDYYNNYCQYPLKLKDELKRVSYNFLEDKFIKYFLSIIVNEKVSHRKLTLIMSFLQVRALLLIYPIDLKAQDEINKIAGLVHILLSESKVERTLTNRAKFADTGITLLYEELRKKGANPRFMKAKMAGGAHMFNFNNSNNALTIGEKNVKVCKETLFKLRIPIISSDVLGSCGRTIIFDTTTNKLKIKSVGKNEKFI